MKASLPEKSLICPCFQEYVIDIVEVCKVGVDLQDPVRLYHNDSYDVEDTCLPAHEWLGLHPCHDIMKTPRNI